MTVATLFTNLRYEISDEDSAEHSDTELLAYLNAAQDYVYATLIDHASNLAAKSSALTFTSGSVALPSDFQVEYAVLDADNNPLDSVEMHITTTSATYKIIDSTIYSDNDTGTLYYFYMPDLYTATTDTLVCPRFIENMYKEMVKFLALNTNEFETGVEQALMNRFEDRLLSLAGKRGASAIVAAMPFMV